MLREITIQTNSPFQLYGACLDLYNRFSPEKCMYIKRFLAYIVQDTGRNSAAYRLGTRRFASGDGLASAPSAIRSGSGGDDPRFRLAGACGKRPLPHFCFVFVLSLAPPLH